MTRGLHSFRIVAASRQDAAEVAAAHARLFDEPWNQHEIDRLLDGPAALAILARSIQTNAVAGFVIAHAAADEADILSIGVTPEWQRCGVARRLVLDLSTVAAAKGAKHLYVDVAADNAPAIALYAGLGFLGRGRRKGYYVRRPGPASDALLLARAL